MHVKQWFKLIPNKVCHRYQHLNHRGKSTCPGTQSTDQAAQTNARACEQEQSLTQRRTHRAPAQEQWLGVGRRSEVSCGVEGVGDEGGSGGGIRWRRASDAEVRVGLQAHLFVVLELPHHHTAELLAVPLASVQKLPHFGGTCGLVHDQFIVLAH